MSDPVITAAIITSITSLVVQIIMFWRVDRVDKKVDDVKQTGEANHILNNSSALNQLKLTALALRANAVSLQRIASMPKSSQGDIEAAAAAVVAADEADRLFHEHEKSQIKVQAISDAAKEPTK